MSAPDNMWSRRRAAVQAEVEADELAVVEAQAVQERAELEEKSDAEILAELNLKNPDDLEAGDDFAGFMKNAVPERLRRRALRKLWLSDPILANVDGLVDYGEDFTDDATVIENLKTSYQVGRGMLKHIQAKEAAEAEELRKTEIAAAADDEADELEPTDVASSDEPDEPNETVAREDVAVNTAPDAQDTETEDITADTLIVSHRMRFEFAS